MTWELMPVYHLIPFSLSNPALTVINSRRKTPGFSPDSYPHVTNGGEKQDERPQEGFAKRASLSRWFASQEGHHGSVPDSHPGVLPPSRRCPPSWSEAIDRSARPTRPASEAQSPRELGALGL